MKSQDIVILLKIVSLQERDKQGAISDPQSLSEAIDPYSVRGLEASLGISKTEVSASLKRSVDSALAIRSGRYPKPNRRNLYEFIAHGLKYAFPAKPGAPQRGIPTAFAAPMLKGELISAGEDIYVWPYANGKSKGLAVEPLFKSVPEAALRDERLYEYLALIDASRLGNQRESNLARAKLEEGLLKA